MESNPERRKLDQKMKKLIGKKSSALITSRNKLELSGCRAIMAYSSELMVIRLCDGVIRIGGKCLEITNFYGGRMIVCGNICCIEYSER